jgi:NADH dehydrogenase
MHSYFGHDEWAEFAPGLKRIVDATRIRRRILLAFERAELTHDDDERKRLLTFVVIGGGATGVEMVGAIAEIARLTLARDFRRIDPRTAQIILLEAGPRILPTLPVKLSDYAVRALTRMGVEVRTATRVTGCDARGVALEQGRIDVATLIWAAGVQASPAAHWLGADADRAGRVLVSPDLSLPGRPEVFVIGDTAAVRNTEGGIAPGVAPAAKQMGRYVGKVLRARLAGRDLPPFRYRHPGGLATIGRRAAVVQFNRIHLTGFIGWLFWSVAHIYFLIGLRYRFLVAFVWLWDFITFQRGARLITEVPPYRRDP